MKRRYILGVAALTTLGLAGTSCSSSKSNTTTSTGGSTSASTGGAAGTTGGATGTTTGGAAGTTGGMAGTTGGATAAGSTSIGCPTTVTPTAPLIADFVGTGADAGIEIIGGISTYASPSGSTAAPTYSISGGALNITESGTPNAAPQYVGTVLYFNDCINASSFTGVKFDISGTMTGCTMQYSTNFMEDDANSSDPKGSCTASSCYAPQKTVTPTTTSTTVSVPFVGGGTGGAPVTTVDTAALTGIQWQFTIGTANCVANVSVTNITFY